MLSLQQELDALREERARERDMAERQQEREMDRAVCRVHPSNIFRERAILGCRGSAADFAGGGE